MDKLIKFSEDHKIISEMFLMYKEILSRVNFYSPLDYVESLNRIFEDTVLPHFEFEENEIFPLVLLRADSDIQNTVSELRDEHSRMKEKLYHINQLKSELGASADAKEKGKLLSLCNELSKELNEHALKEDTTIFPFLKESDLNSK